MPYTEMDNITLTKLTVISQRAQKEPKFQFTSLAHLLNEEFLKECYYNLGRDRASGIDGVSWKEYGKHLDENLKGLITVPKIVGEFVKVSPIQDFKPLFAGHKAHQLLLNTPTNNNDTRICLGS